MTRRKIKRWVRMRLGRSSAPYRHDQRSTSHHLPLRAGCARASTCLAAKKKVDGLTILQNAETVVRVADQCAQQGYKPKQLNLIGAVGQLWTRSPNLEGATATQMNATLPDDSVPATKAVQAALDKYGPGIEKSDQYNELDLSAWAAAEAFALAAEKGCR